MRYFYLIIFLFIHACGCTGLAQTYIEKQASGPFNLLMNPGFENGKAKWTFGTGCGLGSIPYSSVTNVSCTSINTARTLLEQTVTVSEYRPYINDVFKVSIYGASSVSGNVQVCGLFDGAETSCTTVASGDVSLNAEGYKEYVVAVPIPSTQSSSFTVGIRVKTIGTTNTAARFDQAYVGPWNGVVGIGLATTNWTAYTPTFTAFGTVTVQESYWRQVGSNYELDIKFTAGTPTSSEARISLPSGVSSTFTNGIRVAGYWFRGEATANHGGAVLIESGVGYITLSDTSVFGSTAVNPLAKAAGNSTLGAGGIISLKASIPIAGLSGNTTASVVGLVPSETLFSVDVSSTGVVSNETGGDWISGNCTNATTPVCTFTTNWFGGTTPQCWESVGSNITGSIAVTSTTVAGVIQTTGGSGTSGARTYFCRRIGADYTNARQTYSNLVLGNIGVPNGSSTELIARAKLTCSGSSSIVSQSGSWVSSIGNIASGQCTVTINGFASSPVCTVGYNGGFTTAVVVSAEVQSATTIATDCATSPSTACGSYDLNIICMGPKQ